MVTIEALARPPYGVAAHQQIKTLVYIVDSKPVLVLMRGDDQLNEAKLAGQLGTAQFRPADSGRNLRRAGRASGQPGRRRRHAEVPRHPDLRG